MRTVLSISLPPEVVEYIRKEVKRRKFSSISEYIRYLIRLDMEGAPSQKAFKKVYKNEK